MLLSGRPGSSPKGNFILNIYLERSISLKFESKVTDFRAHLAVEAYKV